MKKRIIILTAVLALLVSCTHRVDVALRPDFGTQIQSGHYLANIVPPMKFFMGEYRDKRPDPTMLATFKQQVHTYNLYEERPMADALLDGLKALVVASKQEWSGMPDGDVKIDLTFINLQAARNAGLISVGATSSMQIKADFVNAKTGELIYTNVYTGQDDRSQAMIGLMGMVKDSIDASIVRCIQSIGDDEALAKALAKIRS